MSEWIVTGKTVEQAIEQACAEYGFSSDEITVEVLEMPSRRFFSSTPAKVKITLEQEQKEHTPAGTAKKEQPVPDAPKAQPREEAAPAPAPKTPQAPATPAAVQEDLPEEPATGEKIELAVQFFTTVAAGMGAKDLTVTPVKVGGATILKVEGPSVGVLIGRRGETMEALSYLVSLAANRGEGDYEKIGLDVAGYRAKREKDLASLAKRVGAKVQKTGRSYMFEPMNPYERRIIHSTISEMQDLVSESTGEGAARRVVVRSTAANAQQDKPRGDRDHSRAPRRGGKGGHGNNAERAPRREAPPRPPRPQPKADGAAEAAPRTEGIDDSFDLPLYGKIEL